MTGRPRLSPSDAYARWIEACSRAGWRGDPVTEEIGIGDGLDRVAAAPVHARWPSPREDCAAMDGIAIAAPWTDGAAFTWVDTGDPMPAGTDTVVQRELVEIRTDGSALVTGPAPRGLNVRARGEDFPGGALLVPAGRRLRPADLAAAAAAGHATVAVTRQPVVAIIPTGDEIRPAGTPLARGEIVDSNSVMLAARAAQAGGRAVVSEVQPDEADTIAAEVRRSTTVADLVLILAGSSAGRGDHTAAVLGQVGGLTVQGVAVRPGHPVLLGHAKAESAADVVPVIGVPGYPLAAAVTFELFAMPALATLQGAALRGASARDRVVARATLSGDWTSAPDVEEWVPVTLAAPRAAVPPVAVPPVATPCEGHGAGALSRLVRADAWWRVPIGQGRFIKGQHIDVLLIP
jgi:putative molybdopterin biosynthesis protein